MKSIFNNKHKDTIQSKILILIIVVLVVSPIFITDFNENSNYNKINSGKIEEKNIDNQKLKPSIISGKIHINNNWSWTAGNYSWCTGSGNFADPYVISDLIIDGGGSGSCILIEKTSQYFRIENCTVYNAGDAGIKF